jgi:cold shock CspA family protein
MPHGTLTRIEPALGFGWIVDDAGLDWFFVRDGVRGGALDQLVTDERVTFSYEWTPKGPRATDVALERPQQTA